MPTQIQNPKRILLLSAPNTDTTPLLTTLLPTNSTEQIHSIVTPYYSAHIPIWQDTLPSPSTWIQEWKSLPGASEVVNAIGAWILAFPIPQTHADLELIKAMMHGVKDVVSHYSDSYGGAGEGVMIAVGVPATSKGDVGVVAEIKLGEEEWEDVGMRAGGWEFVDAVAKGRNEFGELRGLERLVEALQVVEWENGGGQDQDEVEGILEEIDVDEDADEDEGEGKEANGVDGDVELQRELERTFGGMEGSLRQPMLGSQGVGNKMKDGVELDDGDEDHVDELQTMLLKLQAARDLGADLPQSERRKLAAQAVKEVMRM